MKKTSFFINKNDFLNVAKLKLSIFSGAFMLPISTLAITALFLALGALFESTQNGFFILFGRMIKSVSWPILNALPVLICVSFAIAYSKNDALAVWCALIAYLTFMFFQNAYIYEETTSSSSTSTQTFKKYVILFSVFGKKHVLAPGLAHNVFGITTLNTSIVGAIIIGGFLVPKVIKKYSAIELPKYISFFAGKRFLPLASALWSIPLAFIFLIFWPFFGWALYKLGFFISKTPYGIDSFLFGFFERLLVPFGFHHAFYSPFWYTPLGGDVIGAVVEKGSAIADTNTNNSTIFTNNTAGSFLTSVANGFAPFTSWQGDSFAGLSAISLPSNQISNKPVFEYFQETLGINVGRFTSGKYPVMQFGLPAAGLAMIFAAPQEKRKEVSAQIIPAMLTSAIIGMTEPLEFLFLFKAPKLFFGFHTVMCGFSFMLMNVFGAHIPSVFSGGFIELFIFGILPVLKGTCFWVWLFVGAIIAPIYFTVFLASIKYFNIETLGRENLQSASEEAFLSHTSNVPENIRNLAIGLGGWDNIETYTNCASRLRYNIVDKNKLNEDYLKKAGVLAHKLIGDNHIQAIVGAKAEMINSEMLKWKNENLDHKFNWEIEETKTTDVEEVETITADNSQKN